MEADPTSRLPVRQAIKEWADGLEAVYTEKAKEFPMAGPFSKWLTRPTRVRDVTCIIESPQSFFKDLIRDTDETYFCRVSCGIKVYKYHNRYVVDKAAFRSALKAAREKVPLAMARVQCRIVDSAWAIQQRKAYELALSEHATSLEAVHPWSAPCSKCGSALIEDDGDCRCHLCEDWGGCGSRSGMFWWKGGSASRRCKKCPNGCVDISYPDFLDQAKREIGEYRLCPELNDRDSNPGWVKAQVDSGAYCLVEVPLNRIAFHPWDLARYLNSLALIKSRRSVLPVVILMKEGEHTRDSRDIGKYSLTNGNHRCACCWDMGYTHVLALVPPGIADPDLKPIPSSSADPILLPMINSPFEFVPQTLSVTFSSSSTDVPK